MLTLFVIAIAVIFVAAVVALVASSAGQRRAELAQSRADALADRNLRLERAVGVAEQALRSMATDTRLDAGMAVQVDEALDAIRRARGDDDPPAIR